MANYQKWQIELRKKLEREAFNEKYKCFICGKKEKLHIHHLIYTENKEDYFNPVYLRILCSSCHARTPKLRKKIKKYIQLCPSCFEYFITKDLTINLCPKCIKLEPKIKAGPTFRPTPDQKSKGGK